MSIIFCEKTQEALRQYMRIHYGMAEEDFNTRFSIVSIPLYGHGEVETRVKNYVNTQLVGYERDIREADLVMITAHSQGKYANMHDCMYVFVEAFMLLRFYVCLYMRRHTCVDVCVDGVMLCGCPTSNPSEA